MSKTMVSGAFLFKVKSASNSGLLPDEKDVALEILDMTSRYNIGGHEPQVVREITQTDQLNKRLLTTFLERMNMVIDPVSTSSTVILDDNTADEFED